MSAFICGDDHFKALAIFAASRSHGYGSASLRVDPRYVDGLDPKGQYEARGLHNLTTAELASLYADVLYQENIRSVRSRYPSDTFNTLPGPKVKPIHIIVSNRDEVSACYRVQVISILKMCDCLEYQSCETDDYRQTVAFHLLNAIRRAAIHALPGYEEAPWDFIARSDAA